MRVCVWDLETSGLEGDVGRLLCASVMDVASGKMTSFRNDRVMAKKGMADDAEIARRVRDELEKYHITIGWYSKGFDIAFLNTRLVKAGHKPLRSHLHLDPIWVCKGWRGLKPRSAKMAVMSEFFNLPERKPGVDVDVWIDAAMGGSRKAMDELVERCEADVRITYKLTLKLLDTGLIKNITSYP